MTIKSLLAFALVLGLSTLTAVELQAQDDAGDVSASAGIQATPKHGLEVGLHGGHFFSSGDVQWNPSWAAGIHFRKALDYVFSLRLDMMYGQAKGDSESSGNRIMGELYTHNTTYASGTLQGVMTLNNLRWNGDSRRKMNLLAFVGAGTVYTKTAVKSKEAGSYDLDDVIIPGRKTGNVVPVIEAGAGLSFRLGEGFNIGLEHKVSTVFGKRTDYLDGTDFRWRDIMNYTSVRLNFNLRGGGKKAEPLYWINPMDVVLSNISELKARPVFDMTDTDGDGVIDMLDQEKDSPAGASVDTRGMTLDSDTDGVPDYMDQEPFSPPNLSVDGNGVAQTKGPNYVTKEDVQDMINNAFGDGSSHSMADWFLPMVHFNIDSYAIRYSDYGNLANIAQVMKSNPNIKVVVQGFTDKTASENYNEVLSYNRAQAAIDHLVNTHGISRSRLILHYGGEERNLVPTNGSSFMNRRVEFQVAKAGEVDMARPQGADAGTGNFNGNKDAGY
ncbi:MAG: OmpA family protein [Saprospiraceae bacterium]|nr:OmpA family protein [Saprospiraceae bacterium]